MGSRLSFFVAFFACMRTSVLTVQSLERLNRKRVISACAIRHQARSAAARMHQQTVDQNVARKGRAEHFHYVTDGLFRVDGRVQIGFQGAAHGLHGLFADAPEEHPFQQDCRGGVGKTAILMSHNHNFFNMLHKYGHQQADEHGSLRRADDVAGVAQHHGVAASDAQSGLHHFHQAGIHVGEDGATLVRSFFQACGGQVPGRALFFADALIVSQNIL